MSRLAILVLALWSALAGLPLCALDQLDTWDDIGGYNAPQTITSTTTTNGTFAGGDGWITTGAAVGWGIDTTVSNATGIIASGSLTGSAGGNLQTVDTYALRRVLPAMTPTASQPVWISFILEPKQTQNVGMVDTTCHNFIQFYDGDWTAGSLEFSMNTEGTRVNGTTTTTSDLRWRLNQTEPGASTSLEVVDGVAQLVVIEVQTTQLSLWIYPSATPSTISASNPLQTATLVSVPTFDRMQFASWADLSANPQVIGSLYMDNIHFGTSLLAVTSLSMPHVTGVAPASANNAGGDTVAISGTNFSAPASVTFGGAAASSVSVTSSSALSVLVPPPTSAGFTGVVDLVVGNATGQVLHPQSFTYTAPSTADPALVTAPTITTGGGLQAGAVLGSTSGTWNPQPSSFGYDWQHSVHGGAYTDTGITTATYTLGASDAGTSLVLIVTPGGATTAISATSAPVAIPTSTVVANAGPQISGSTLQGGQLTVTSGTWLPAPSGFTYQWQRSALASGAGALPISGATSTTYTVSAADFGSFLLAVVTADGTTSTATSNVVAILTPANTAIPTIVGSVQPGGTVAAQPGTWLPQPAGFTYQWQLQASASAPAIAIAGATAATYQIPTADLGALLSVTVAVQGAPSLLATSAAVPIAYQKIDSTYLGAEGTVGSSCGLSAGLICLGLGLMLQLRRSRLR